MAPTNHRGSLLWPAAASLATLVALGALFRPTPPAAPSVGAETTGARLVIQGFDTSGSNQSGLPLQARAAAGVTRRLEAGRDLLACYRVDRVCAEFHDGAAPEGFEASQRLLVAGLREPAEAPGTRPAPFWTTAAERADRAAGPVVVLFCTDGEIDDPSHEALRELKAAVGQLAANERVRKVVFWGLRPASRAQIRRLFKGLGDRLELHGPEDMQPEALTRALR